MTSPREDLTRLLRTGSAGQRRAAIPRVADGEPVPLDPSQASIWHFSQLFPDSAEYNVLHTLRVENLPSEAQLAGALRTLIERHDALRLRIFQRDGVPVQEDPGPYDPEITWHDLSGSTAAEADRQALALITKASEEVIHPDEPPLARFTAIRLPSGGALIAFRFHHVIEDGWSWALLSGELTTLLAGRSLEPPPPTRYIDYIACRRASIDEKRKARDLAYWTDRLSGRLPILDLPADRPRPPVPDRSGHTLPFELAADLLLAAERLARDEGTTLFVVTLAAYEALLARLTGQSDIIVGSVLAGRDDAIAERLFGCFVRSVALRTTIAPTDSFRDAIRAVHDTVLEAQDHQYVPFEEIVANLDIQRTLNVDPVFQTYFTFHEFAPPDLPGAVLDPMGFVGSGSTQWDLTMFLTRTSEGCAGILEGSAELFDRTTLERFAGMYSALFEGLVNGPDPAIAEHALESAAGRDRILYGLNPCERPEQSGRTLAEPFEEQVARTPNVTALVNEEGLLTYAELNARANRLARFLRERGARPGAAVALWVERGFDMFTAVYAVAKTGATYVPLDLQLPDDRLASMLEDIQPCAVLTDAPERNRVPGGPWNVISLDGPAAWRHLSADDPDWTVPRGTLSHMLYTPGASGRPKAVAASADAALADIAWMQRRYPYRPGDTAILKTSYGFDVSLWELFWPLYAGARVFVPRPGGHRDVRYLAEVIERYGVTHVQTTSTQLQVLLEELDEDRCAGLRWVISGGDTMTPRLRDTCQQKLSATLVSWYGPPEAGRTTDMIVPIDPADPVVPLGRPSPNFRLHVLDENLHPKPIGLPGEAYIAAEVDLAQGYHRLPELTAERFLPDPFGPPGTRMYRTGDLCRYRDDGVLEHLGRIGSQVKVREMRIELAEIDSVLCEHHQVQRCVTITVDGGAEQALAGFVVATPGAAPTEGELREHAARMLPAYMVPTTIQVVDAIPVDVNGEVDSRALLDGWAGRSAGTTATMVPPADEVEAAVAAIFCRVLGLDKISMTGGFFEHGGHSLLVFKLLSAIADEMHVQLAAVDVFTTPTVRELTERIRAGNNVRQGCVIPIHPAAGRPLIVLVHAASGSALPFKELAGHLADAYSVYGVEAPDEDEGAASIEELAARYVAELDPIRDLSPICLVGWSMGGAVALEMSRNWQVRGVNVATTVMLDSWPPPALFPAKRDSERQRQVIEDLDIGAAEGVDAASLGVTGERLARVTERNRRALLEYRPESLSGQAHYLHATGPFPDSSLSPVGDGGEWKQVVGDLTRRDIPGTHFSLLHADNAAELAATISDIFDDSLSYGEL